METTMYNHDQLNEMTQAQLIEVIIELQQTKTKKSHRKYAVLELLQTGPMTILDIANEMTKRYETEISTKNVSSLLTYLRQQDNVKIHTDDKGRKYIIE